ncbi:hypothetical protein ACLKA6_011902 [Drosophila palustris]
MVEEFLEKLPEIDTRYEDIVPMEQVSSMVSNGGGSVTMQRDDEYRNRIMKSAQAESSRDFSGLPAKYENNGNSLLTWL